MQGTSSTRFPKARTWVAAGLALVAGVLIAMPLAHHFGARAQQQVAATAGPVNATPVPTAPPAGAATPAARALPDFADLVDQVGPAVVNIRTTAKTGPQAGSAEMDEQMQEFFRRFFGVPMPRQNPQRPNPRGNTPEEEVQRGVGSGFIVSADGYVMTNAHVVDGADQVYVRLTDKREFKARIIGADKRTDVALVKIEASGLPLVRFGDINRLRVGEWVIAIGSPFNLDNTVTAGIVSAKARDTGDMVPFIQTDVAINPGNSGGPLINMRGEVVGINSQIYSRSGGYMGISFAIPADEAQRVADQLRANGRVIRGRIGVQIGEVSKEVADQLGLAQANGALVRSVEQGGPAEKAGVEAGDIVTKFDGRAIERWNELPRFVGNTKPGTKSTLQVLRQGKYRDLSVTVAELESDAKTAQEKEAPPAPRGAQANSALLGLSVTDLTDAQKRELKLKGGVRVVGVEGPAERAGLAEDDLVLSVNNTSVADTKQFEAALAKLDKSRPVTLLVRRGEWVQYVVVRPNGR
jgi:serine protease Do